MCPEGTRAEIFAHEVITEDTRIVFPFFVVLFQPASFVVRPTGSGRGRGHFEGTNDELKAPQQPDDPAVWRGGGIGCLCTSCFGRRPLCLEIPFSPKEVIILGKRQV